MLVPVTLYRLAYGFVPGASDELEHGVFTTEAAAMRVLDAVRAEALAGRVQMTTGKSVYVYPFPSHIDAEDPKAAAAAGYAVDLARLVPAPEPEPAPVTLPVEELAP